MKEKKERSVHEESEEDGVGSVACQDEEDESLFDDAGKRCR